MASEANKGLPSGLPLLATVALIGGAVLLSRRELESPRPSPPAAIEPVILEEDKVGATLWEDPFQAALDHEREFHCSAKETGRSRVVRCSSGHGLGLVAGPIEDAGGNGSEKLALQILLVMVSSRPAFEEQENRLRSRYAVLTALRASGMVPEDSSHLQYFKWPQGGKPAILPFECFRPREFDRPDANDPPRPRRILVIWLPDEAFEDRPLERIATLLQDIGWERGRHRELCEKLWQRKAICADLIGPTSSTILAEMLGEIKSPADGRPIFERPDGVTGTRWLRVFSPWSTVSPVLLLEDWKLRPPQATVVSQPSDPDGGSPKPGRRNQAAQEASGESKPFNSVSYSAYCPYRIMCDVFQAASIDFIRTVGTDDLLAEAIIGELQRRGVEVTRGKEPGRDEIVLLVECDQHYGRAFPRTLGMVMKGADDDNDEKLPGNLHVYSYTKGIDGKLPKAREQTPQSPAEPRQADSQWMSQANLEAPVGCGQLDYVRRLMQKLQEERHRAGRPGPKAIGVVGTDVYDKLILLHALREQFGNGILLFTTDLDARLLHHEQLRWTRNLIVVSHFGLELDSNYADGLYSTTNRSEDPSAFPPFRETYQAALFLACRDALEQPGRDAKAKPLHAREPHELADVLGQPRIFEIGRHGPVDLSISKNGSDVRLHPPREQYYHTKPSREEIGRLLLAVASVVLLIAVCAPVWAVGESALRGRKTPEQAVTFKVWRLVYVGAFAPLAVGALLTFAGFVLYDHYLNPAGEPFSLSAGTSIWPGLGLWLVAILVGAYSVLRTFEILQANNLYLQDQFGLPDPRRSSGGGSQGDPESVWRCFLAPFPKLWGESAGTEPIAVEGLWRWYTQAGRTIWRLCRSGVAALTLGTVIAVMMVLLGRPFTPFRGTVSAAFHAGLGLALGILLLMVLFLVIDATILGLGFVTLFLRRGTRWPDSAAKHWNGGQKILPMEDLSDWLEIEFIGGLSEATGKLLYLPAVVLLLAVAGRFPYFDNWGFPWHVMLVYVFCALLIVLCAIGMWLVAVLTRRTAQRNLDRKLRAAKFGADEKKEFAAQIARMIKEIRATRRGAFQSFAESPVVHFLLIPSGGVSLLALLQYFLSA